MRNKILIVAAVIALIAIITTVTLDRMEKDRALKEQQNEYISALIAETTYEAEVQLMEVDKKIEIAKSENNISKQETLLGERVVIIDRKMRRISALKLLPETIYCKDVAWLMKNGDLGPSDMKYMECRD